MSALFDIIPVKYRRLAYLIATAVLWLYGIWQASNDDWKTFVGSVLTSLAPLLAAANAVPVGSEAAPVVEDPEDDAAVPGSGTVDDVLDPQFPNDDADLDDDEDEFPEAGTLYQPGEQPYERFGTQADFVETAPGYDDSPEANQIRDELRAAGVPAVDDWLDEQEREAVSTNDPVAETPLVPDYVQRAADDLK